MDAGSVLGSVAERLTPVDPPHLDAVWALSLVGAAVACTLVPAVWLRLRIAVTLVHELGHAFVGILCGRRFTGFVVRGDMSGHAVTHGRPRGFGRVASTWAGYPMPGVVGAVMVAVAVTGWAAPLLFALLLVLVLSLVRVRSAVTLLVVALALAGVGALWWAGGPMLQALVLVGAGIVLVVGGWRHLGIVAAAGRRSGASDPVILARLTGVPWAVWILSFALVLALSTGGAGMALWHAVAR